MTFLEVLGTLITAGITAGAGVVVAWFTKTLARVGVQQQEDARNIQRAFISVNPKGIDTTTFGALIGHVIFENVGRSEGDIITNTVSVDYAVFHNTGNDAD